MAIVKITSDSKYAKLDEDITFTIQYENALSEEEIQTEWIVYYTPDIIFKENRRQCTVKRVNTENTVILNIYEFKETLCGLSILEKRNVGYFTLNHSINGHTDDIILVVQTYSEDEVNVILERAVEQME